MTKEFYEYDSWLNPNILYLFNRNITEFDLKSAGTSIIREHNLLSNDRIEKLLSLSKDAQHRQVGLYQRDDKNLIKSMNDYFVKYRKMFIDENKLEKDDIISTKKDAIFPIKPCSNRKFGEYIKFVPKNMYTSYIRLNKRLEIYYNQDNIDIKGIGDENIKLHQNGMIYVINKYIYKIETFGNEAAAFFIKEIYDNYKAKELPLCYYRRFDSISKYDIISDKNIIDEFDITLDDIDIGYNIQNVLIKLAKIAL